MFAFALWDRKQAELFLARDRLGVKPVYYATLDDGTFLFGSELKALLAHPRLVRELDPLAVEDYFALGYIPEPRTIFRKVHKLPPAHSLRVRRGEPVPAPTPYWDVRFTVDSRVSEPEAIAELQRHLRESVQLRMIADVPLGPFCPASRFQRSGRYHGES
jgi:asparagine synthase (glutamine-hydrolysing)